MTKEERIAQLLTVTPEVEALGKMIDEMDASYQVFYQNAKNVSLKVMLEAWLETVKPSTKKSYEAAMRHLFEGDQKILEYDSTVIDLESSRTPGYPDWIIEHIGKTTGISEQEKVRRQDIYVSFTKYLHAMTGGAFKRVYFRCKCGEKEEPFFSDYYRGQEE